MDYDLILIYTVLAGKDRFIGDMMSLSGAFLYGVSGVAQEFVIKTFDWIEFLGMIGLFGSFICGLQTLVACSLS